MLRLLPDSYRKIPGSSLRSKTDCAVQRHAETVPQAGYVISGTCCFQLLTAPLTNRKSGNAVPVPAVKACGGVEVQLRSLSASLLHGSKQSVASRQLDHHWIRGWMGLSVGLDALTLLRIETRTVESTA